MKKINDINVEKNNNYKLENVMEKQIEVRGLEIPSYNIFFIGFMGVGKTTVSSYLSKLLDRKEIEIDKYICEKENMTIPEIFEKYGEAYFRDCETNTLQVLNDENKTIISCGGGIVLREENVKLMKKQGKIILLTATPKTIFERVRYSNERPILNNNMNVEFISSLMKKREKKYLDAADLIIDTNNKTIPEICEEILLDLNKTS